MNSTRCSEPRAGRRRRAAAVALLVVVVLGTVAVPVAAVSVAESDVPEEAAVGDPVRATFTLTDIYSDNGRWRLVAASELVNATWRIRYFNQTGSRIRQVRLQGQRVEGPGVTPEQRVGRIEVVLTGFVPEVRNFTYPANNSFVVAQLEEAPENGALSTIESWQTVQFTEESRDARQAIREAERAINDAREAGADPTGAEQTLEQAKDVYRQGAFSEAIDLAERAKSEAESAREDAQAADRTNQFILIGVGVLVVLGLAGGGFYYYRERQRQGNKLR